MIKRSTLLAGLLFSCFGAFSQSDVNGNAASFYKNAEKVVLDPQTQALQFLRFKPGAYLQPAAFPEWLRTNLKTTDSEWREFSTFEDQAGFRLVRYQQYHHNVPVTGMVFIAHVKNGEVVSCNGEYKQMPATPLRTTLSAQDAYREALRIIGAKTYMWQNPAEEQLLKNITNNSAATYYPKAELVYAPVSGNFETDDFVPAYKLDIYATEPLERSIVYLSAATGKLLFKENRLHDAHHVGTVTTRYSGTQTIFTKKSNGLYRLDQDSLGVRIRTLNMNRQMGYAAATEFTDADNIWANRNTLNDDVAGDVHWGAEMTFKYYKTLHNRNSFDNAGRVMLSYVHFAQGFNNAFWDGTRMTYGDGDGAFMNPLTSLDVVGHEFTHGVTEYSADLMYFNESGALNESFSDIFGVAIDFNSRGSNANYLIGEDIVVGSGALRNMQNPNQFSDPDTYMGKHWKPLNGPDNGGVHSNSGVQNFWFYLLVNGGQGINDKGDSYNVPGIGMAKAEKIAYSTLMILTPTSNYADAATMSLVKAELLYGVCSPEAKAVSEAWYAVGVGTPYNLKAAFTAENDYYCSVPASVTFSNLSFNANTYIWDFGDGQTSTQANPTHVYNSPGIYPVKLIAVANAPVCGATSDTLERTGYITVVNGVSALAACQPTATANPQSGAGITKVVFNTFTKTSADALEGYKDFACNKKTQLIAGNVYDLTLGTGTTPQRARAWIDYNNDGAFDPVNEVVAVFTPFVVEAIMPVRTSPTAVLNTPLRMRIATDQVANSSPSPCGPLQTGQFEDYSVEFVAQTAAPEADFRASRNYILPTNKVNFTDISNFQPTSWEWSFPGGNPSTSTDQNPANIAYPGNGIYSVRLIVRNALGTDTLTRASYIHVGNVTGTAENLAELNQLTVYPNPATDKITIQYGFTGKKSLTVMLVNTLGQKVMQKQVTAASQLATELDVRNMAAGVYFLQISDGEALVTKKLILQK
ncbi:M4 family metallopeptidase [Adhaeribacter soli]|uniref:PKD domain-containing protein n=1 Tax=Adhaeribacter soli TaxID=2607655 RepID=A0A5N1IM78_9BACT|nr:M4 family metallopeptidase [Adhaeribacter soli]KAA9325017.1 PKD domain-containing protein [Adhaeribacter soli]